MEFKSCQPVRVKICGITSLADADIAVSAGADALGLVFYEQSPRAITIDQAIEIAKSAGPYVSLVGLFVNASADYIRQVLERVNLHVLQFHGDETNEFCNQFSRSWYKAIRMHPDLNPNQAMDNFPDACGYLFDAWNKDKYGGTGETFCWDRLPQHGIVIVAGGLNPDNIEQAVKATYPYAVDVSGGVESAPGKKDPQLVKEFISRAKSVSAQ